MAFFSFPSQVNERAARVVASVVATSVALAWVADFEWIFPVLALGFALRVGWGPRFSPLARTAMFVASRAWEVVPVSGAPKRFAQGIGATFMLGATAALALGRVDVAWALGGVIVVFATLEAALAFCAGCFVYAQLQRAGIFPPDVCVDCAPLTSKTSPSA